MLQEDVLDAPETPGGERGNLGVCNLCGRSLELSKIGSGCVREDTIDEADHGL